MVPKTDHDGECARCDRTDRDTTEHVIRYFDDRDPERVDICAPCVREVTQDDSDVRSIT